MRVVLHIMTQSDDTLAELAQRVIAGQRAERDQEVHVVDLTSKEPDYAKLLDEIFAADSVAVW